MKLAPILWSGKPSRSGFRHLDGHRYVETKNGIHLGRGQWALRLEHDEKNCAKCKNKEPTR